MSRYTTSIPSAWYAWGYDEPTNTYFFEKFDEFALLEDNDMLWSIGSRFTVKPHPDYPKKYDYSNRELLAIFQKEIEENELDIPVEHLAAIKANEPF
jgi:hypothetical protein